MRHRLRVGSWSVRLDIRFNGLLDLAAHQPVVRQVVLDTKNFSNKRLASDPYRETPHACASGASPESPSPCRSTNRVAESFRLWVFPRKFGVYHFIDPVAKLAAALDSAQNICSARPSPTSKGCLYDDVRASAHGLCRSRRERGACSIERSARQSSRCTHVRVGSRALASSRVPPIAVVARRSWDAAQCLVRSR